MSVHVVVLENPDVGDPNRVKSLAGVLSSVANIPGAEATLAVKRSQGILIDRAPPEKAKALARGLVEAGEEAIDLHMGLYG